MAQVHLMVLVHGMWGNIHHFEYMRDELVARGAVSHDGGRFDATKLPEDKETLVVYRTHGNEGYFTYDGIDVCGSRVAQEINAEIALLRAAGVDVKRISLIGYSMGGLMVRYAAGILYTQGVFDDVQPEIFTTFCSPHVGVNVLGSRFSARVFNFIGSWSMARTSRQVFLEDAYEKSGTPLFKHLTDANTPFIKALKLFKRRVLYANVVNDRRCDYYTAAIEDSDPFQNALKIQSLAGPFAGTKYAPIVIKGTSPQFNPFGADEAASPVSSSRGIGSWFRRALSYAGRVLRITKLTVKLTVVLPLWFVAFLLNVTYQTTVSTIRTYKIVSKRTHIPTYEFSDLLEEQADELVEQAYTTIGDERALQVTSLMRKIIDQLNTVGWEKYPIHITAEPNAHAAAIVRMPKKPSFWQGKVVISHWIDEILQLA